jgi:hypothetical protein
MDPEVKRQLDLRLAKGEITREEYSDTLKALTEGDKSAGDSSVFSMASGAFNNWLTKLKDPHGELSYRNVEPTDEAPLIVNDELSLFGTTLKFRQTTLRYSDIRSLSFDGLRQTINQGLTTYYARLGILPPSGEWIHALGEWKHKAFFRPQNVTNVKLVENAYSFLAPLTFQQRLQRRLDEIVRNPDPHYTPPTVVFLDPEAKQVLTTVIYKPDFVKRAKELARALDEIKGKF